MKKCMFCNLNKMYVFLCICMLCVYILGLLYDEITVKKKTHLMIFKEVVFPGLTIKKCTNLKTSSRERIWVKFTP